MGLIKGGGGALLREKMVAAASATLVIIADATKIVQQLGAFPLPVEVVTFALPVVRRAVEKLGGKPVLSGGDSAPYVTVDGHFIDWKSGVYGKSVSVRVDCGGRRIHPTKTIT